MKSKKTIKWIVVAILIDFAVTGALTALASNSEPTEGTKEAAVETAGPDPEESVTAVPAPASTSGRMGQPIAMDATLIGTAVVDGGTSFAVLQSADGTRLVREGDEIASGVRLVEVGRNRIEVESREGRQEIRIGSTNVARQQIRPGPGLILGLETPVNRGPVTPAAVERMQEFRRQMFKRRVVVSRRSATGAGGR